MSLDRSLETYRELYYDAADLDRDAIDDAFEAAYKVLQRHGFTLSGTDLSENLVTAIVKYVVESGNAI